MGLGEGSSAPWVVMVYYHYYAYPDEHRVMPHFGVRAKRYQLIRFYGDDDFWELYDLDKDSIEMKNIYGQPKFKKLTKGLKQDLKALIKAYDDPEANKKMMGGK